LVMSIECSYWRSSLCSRVLAIASRSIGTNSLLSCAMSWLSFACMRSKYLPLTQQPYGRALDRVASRVAASNQCGANPRHVVVAQKQREGTRLQLEHQYVSEPPDQRLQRFANA
jgi:hypothetical protein